MSLKKGDRVKLSEIARREGILPPFYNDREGVIVGRCRDSTLVKVLFDGTKSAQNYHRDFIELVGQR